MSFSLSEQTEAKIEQVMQRYPEKRAATLPILHLIQEEKGWISEEAQNYVAQRVEVPPIKIREVLSFYTLLRTRKIGKFHFQVCRTVACTLRGGKSILQHLEKKLGIKSGETSADGMFTLTEVECLAACEIAPMLQLNDDYIGPLTPEKLDELIDGLK